VDDTSLADAGIEFSLLKRKNGDGRKAHQRVIKGETSKVNIKACNFGDKAGVSQDYNYVVCVLDSEAGSANLYDAEQFVSQRSVKVLEAKEAELASATSSGAPSRSSTPAQDYKAAKALLGETFGTKKVKQALNSQEKNQINIGQLESSASGFINRNLDKSIDRIQEASSVEISEVSDGAASNLPESNSGQQGILPPYNDKTGKVEEIYKLADIIPTEAYRSLPVEDFSDDSTESWEAIQARYHMSDYILDRIKNASSAEDAGHRLRSLLYLHYLIKLREMKDGALNSETSLQKFLPAASPALTNHLLESFTESFPIASGQIRRKFSAISKDRIITHICILVLLLEDGFRANLTILSTILHIPVTRMTDHFKAVGCTIDKPTKGEPATFTPPGQTRSLQIKIATLKAPLTFPKPKRGPMK